MIAMYKRVFSYFLTTLMFAGIAGAANAVTLTYVDKATWLADLSGASSFSFTASNLDLADGVAGPPSHLDRFGQQLNFDMSNTGQPASFSFNVDPTEIASGVGNEIIYVENPLGDGLGVATTAAEHDWRVDLEPGSNVFAMGMTIRGGGTPDDSFAFLSIIGGILGGSFSGGAEPFFVGIISDQQIGGFLYDDSNLSGGRILTELAIGDVSTVPVPAALPLFLSGLVGLGLLHRRRRRNTQAV